MLQPLILLTTKYLVGLSGTVLRYPRQMDLSGSQLTLADHHSLSQVLSHGPLFFQTVHAPSIGEIIEDNKLAYNSNTEDTQICALIMRLSPH